MARITVPLIRSSVLSTLMTLNPAVSSWALTRLARPLVKPPLYTRTLTSATVTISAGAMTHGVGDGVGRGSVSALHPQFAPHRSRPSSPNSRIGVAMSLKMRTWVGLLSSVRAEVDYFNSRTRACMVCRCCSAARSARWRPSSRYSSPR